MSKRMIALSLAFLMCLLGGCAKSEKRTDSIPRDARVLTLAVETGLSAQADEGITCFVDKVRQISQGQLIINVVESTDILDHLENGAELVFGSASELARANGNFNSYVSPFYFYNYEHLSLTLNSGSFYNIIRDSNISLMNAMPIAAFYDGSYVIISSRERMFDTVDQYIDSVVNISGDLLLEEVLEAFGAKVKERSSEYILLNFARNRDNAAMECDSMLLDQINIPEQLEEMFVCKSFHRARVNFLMLSQPAKEALSSYEQAVLAEAAAYAIAKNDELVLQQEEKGMTVLRDLGAQIISPNYGEFSEAADKALRASARYSNLWDWDQHVEVRKLAVSMQFG